MVLQAITKYFPVENQSIIKGLQNFHMPGRFQVVPGEVSIIMDVAHNRQSAANLSVNISNLPKTGKIKLVLAMLKDKNHSTFITELLPIVDTWYLSTLGTNRGATSTELANTLKLIDKTAEVYTFDSLDKAMSKAYSDATTGDRLLTSGSFITVSIAIKHFGVET